MLYAHPAPAGARLAVVAGRTAVLVEAASGAPDPEALADALTADAPVQAVLELLSADGIGRTPDFALLHDDGAGTLHCVVRGAGRVAARAGEEVRLVDGAGVATWLEESVADAEDVEAGLGAGPAERHWLPVERGSCWADALRSAPGTTLLERDAPPAHSPAEARPAAAPAAAPGAEGTDAPAPARAAERADAAAPAAPEPAAPSPADAPEPAGNPHADARTEAENAPAPAPADAAPPPPPAVPVPAPPAAPAEDGDEYDHLFGATVLRSVESAAVRPHDPEEDEEGDAASAPEPAPTPAEETALGTEPAPDAGAADPAADDERPGDHDGETVFLDEVRGRTMRPPMETQIPPVDSPAPARHRVEWTDGSVEALDAPIVVGRSPKPTGGGAAERLVTVASEGNDLSRSHVRLAVEGGAVVVTDLHSRNGTLLTLPGREPQRLRGGEPTPVVAGALLDLGDGLTLTVRED